MDLQIITELTADDIKFIDKQIINFNLLKVPTEETKLFQSVNFAIKDSTGQIIAGILGQKYYWNCAYLDVLWVAEEHRNKKLGSKLLSEFENELKSQNCQLIHLDTFDFQAPQFYETHGYKLYGELKDNPKGHSRFYYFKLLT